MKIGGNELTIKKVVGKIANIGTVILVSRAGADKAETHEGLEKNAMQVGSIGLGLMAGSKVEEFVDQQFDGVAKKVKRFFTDD